MSAPQQTDPEAAPRAGAVLARAFQDDAMFTAIQPDPGRRQRQLPRFFTGGARMALRYGELHLSADGAAAAVWMPPGLELGPGVLMRSGMALAVMRFGPAGMRRFLRITSAFDAAHAELVDAPCWHLLMLGVEPSHQGQGRGGALIAPMLARADQAGERCYLDTSEERNVPFYERHGFHCPGRRQPPADPPFWPMLREPR